MGPRFQEIPQRKRILENKSVIFRERKATIWIIIMSPPKKEAITVWCALRLMYRWKKAKAMWSLRHTRVERAVHSPSFFFYKAPLPFFPFSGVNDNTTTRQHISRGGTLLSRKFKMKKEKERKTKEESNLLANERISERGEKMGRTGLCNVWIKEKRKRLLRCVLQRIYGRQI